MSDKLKYEQDGHVVTLTLNQPETMNAITDPDMVEAGSVLISSSRMRSTTAPTAVTTS